MALVVDVKRRVVAVKKRSAAMKERNAAVAANVINKVLVVK